MLRIETTMLSFPLGDKLFYSAEHNRHILAPSLPMAIEILRQLRLEGDLENLGIINDADSVQHRCGQSLHIQRGTQSYITDTVLVLGVPAGIDTTKSCKVVYKR